jgi:hypothetical protein
MAAAVADRAETATEGDARIAPRVRCLAAAGMRLKIYHMLMYVARFAYPWLHALATSQRTTQRGS